MDLCAICQESLSSGETSALGEKGCKGIIKASVLRNDELNVTVGQFVHKYCRQQYCNVNTIKRDVKNTKQSSIPARTLRSEVPVFSFSKHCLFCGHLAKLAGKKRGQDVFPVRTTDFQTSVKQICMERGDQWADTVYSRIEFVQDLHAADAVYHQACSSNFRTKKQVPLMYQLQEPSSKRPNLGRKKDPAREEAFTRVAEYLVQNDDEQITITHLLQKMEEYGCSDVYTATYMKSKLREHFGNNLIITDVTGKTSVVTFRKTALSILHEFYETPKQDDTEAEKMRMIKTAAELIKNDIKGIFAAKETYPSPEEISSVEANMALVPQSLQLMLNTIFAERKPDVKVASVGQVIIQAARPRTIIAPLQIGLAVQLHHHFASKFLIDSLHNHGFCSSYTEVKRFEMSAAASQGTDIPNLREHQFVQYVADNADHNINTLDGLNTFHGMGIIAAVTPGTKQHKPIFRDLGSKEDVTLLGKINIRYFKEPPSGMVRLHYDRLKNLDYLDPTKSIDVLWNVVWPLRQSRPGWSGFMQASMQGPYPGQSSVMFLPMIDMNATDMSCIYSTLKFVCKEARRHMVRPVITFDQPLWWKAQLIVASESKDDDLQSLVLRLGGFHVQMSFLGCIGHIMQGSGIQEILEVSYAANTVPHMLSGKAFARAFRGHFLVNSALNDLLCSLAFNTSLHQPSETDGLDTRKTTVTLKMKDQTEMNQASTSSANKSLFETDTCSTMDDDEDDDTDDDHHNHDDTCDEDLRIVASLFDKLTKKEIPIEDICEDPSLQRVEKKIQDLKQSLSSSRTACLWLQYIDMVDLLKQFIKAERTGNWLLHLKSLKAMLPYFAAADHNMYTKSVYIYLQQMMQLEAKKPDVFASFMSGHHVIRRSDRYWAGLSADLVIEQVLMRSIKTTGGLTHGRGMSESQRALWLLSMPVCSDVNNAMQVFSSTTYSTSDQHKDLSELRQKRDKHDISHLVAFLRHRSPFSSDDSLRNIVTGVTSHDHINMDRAKEVGIKILQAMEGKNVMEYTFRKKDQVQTFSTISSVKISGETVPVDPQLLFQRLVTAARGLNENIAEIFQYELCTPPSSLFEPSGLLRQANKPALADAIWTLGKASEGNASVVSEMKFVLDGGSLLQRLPWPRNSTFSSICQVYVEYVKRKYDYSTIVFDGYGSEPSTKDVTHLRRSKHGMGPQVNLGDETPSVCKKETFLSNSANKQKFINMLSGRLQKVGCKTVHADGDADLLIVQTAVEISTSHATTVVGEDTDLLVLLCHHAAPTSCPIFMMSEGKKQRTWDIHHIQRNLGHDICRLLPFVHAVAGCDTTSRLFGIGKGMTLKKLKKDPYFRQQAEEFCKSKTKQEIVASGERVLVHLYSGTPDERLDDLRFQNFCERVVTGSAFVQVHTLPPTSAAAKYDNLRVYLQVQQWMGNSIDLTLTDWGWKEVLGRLQPETTHLPPAPDALLHIIRCNCKTDCDTRRCTCKKHGLECSVACGECKGVSCTNSSVIWESTEDPQSEDDQ